jgi:hypothetical protein
MGPRAPTEITSPASWVMGHKSWVMVVGLALKHERDVSDTFSSHRLTMCIQRYVDSYFVC